MRRQRTQTIDDSTRASDPGGIRIVFRKQQIAENEWQRAYAMGMQYLKVRPGVAREGSPIYSAVPAGLR